MKLRELLQDIYAGPIPEPFGDKDISRVTCDSRRVLPDSLFIAKKGGSDDGMKYVADAVKKGARVIASDRPVNPSLIPDGVGHICLTDIHAFIERAAARFYAIPPEKIKVIGVTGTNGKTTTTYLLESIFEQAGEDCGVIGTVNYRMKGRTIGRAMNTTPGLLEGQELLCDMVRQGVSYCFMEVSSHALAQERTKLIPFHAAVFTNLSMDHLDYHENMDSYFLTKAKLFQSLKPGQTAVINRDDAYASRLFPLVKAAAHSFGIKNEADIMAKDIRMDKNRTRFQVISPEGEFPIETGFIGAFNVYNLLGAIGMALAEGVDVKVIQSGLAKIPFIPGRLERVVTNRGYEIFIDYAHTPDALCNVLKTLRSLAPSRIIVVFGCGGNRDSHKRPVMGSIASELADFSVVTSDNPRGEDPEDIVREVIRGFEDKRYAILIDRRQAIQYALDIAQEGDIILIAGKGHETYQIMGSKRVAFSERSIINEILSQGT